MKNPTSMLSPFLAATFLAVFGVALAGPSDDDCDEFPTLVAQGQAQVAVQPDLAVVRLGAMIQFATAAGAQEQVNVIMQRVIDALMALGVPHVRIQTTGLSLNPVYSRPDSDLEEPTIPQIVAYRASNSVRVEIDDLSLTGDVIDAGLAAGANQLESLSFQLRDDTLHRAKALHLATRNAKLKAKALADAAGVELLAVHRIAESGVQTFTPYMRVAAMASTPIEPGQVHVEATVELVYRIGPDESAESGSEEAEEAGGDSADDAGSGG